MIAAAAAAGATAAGRGRSLTFRDPVGDSYGQADIAYVTVSAPRGGHLRFVVGLSAPFTPDEEVDIYIKASTRFGGSYNYEIDVRGFSHPFALKRINEANYKPLAVAPSVRRSGHTLTIEASAGPMHLASTFGFSVQASTGSTVEDEAPDDSSAYFWVPRMKIGL
jgi:hypothetical protein